MGLIFPCSGESFRATLAFFALVLASFRSMAEFRLFFEGGVGAWRGALRKKWVLVAAKELRPLMAGESLFRTSIIKFISGCATRTELAARASPLVLHMRPAPRQVCPAEGSYILVHGDDVPIILSISRNYFALEAAHAINQRVTRFARYRRTALAADEYIAEFDLLSRKAESEMEIGAGLPGQFMSISRMDNAA